MIKMLKDRLNKGALKFLEELYRNLWFLVKKKKPRDYKLINLVIHLNTIIRQDVNLLLLVDKFIEEFTRY